MKKVAKYAPILFPVGATREEREVVWRKIAERAREWDAEDVRRFGSTRDRKRKTTGAARLSIFEASFSKCRRDLAVVVRRLEAPPGEPPEGGG